MKTITRIILCTVLDATFFTAVDSYCQSKDQFNDAEIAAIAVAANDIDIKYAEIAKEKSNNEEVLGFANTMINDHKAVIDQAVDLVRKLKVEPRSNSLSNKLN